MSLKSTEPLLRAESLSLQRGGRDVLAGLPDIALHGGKHTMVIGPSGCGKTTLLHALTGLLPVEGGSIVFRGLAYKELSQGALDQLRGRHFGIVFQRLHLISHLTVYQNVCLSFSRGGKEVMRESVFNLLDSLGLGDKKNNPAYTLSQGEAQRAAFARAVVHKPDILFADEPTSALDDVNAGEVCRLLLDLCEKNGTALVISTHDERLRRIFDGQVVEMGK